MKPLLTTLTIFLAFVQFAQTNVGGTVSANTTWTMANSPYHVNSDIIIAEQIVLIIEPGVTVKFANQKGMIVNGTLKAIGTDEEPIVFTTVKFVPSIGSWANIVFRPGSTPYNFSTGDGCIMEHCTLQYGGNGSSSFWLRHPVAIDNAAPYVNNCTFQKNYGAIGASSVNGDLHITNNRIIDNDAVSVIMGAVVILVEPDQDSLFFHCNLFSKNDVGNGQVLDIRGKATISNNILVNTGYSSNNLVYLKDDVLFTKNQLIDNYSNTVLSGGGSITHNTITRNGDNIYHSAFMNNDSTTHFNYNNIYDNNHPPFGSGSFNSYDVNNSVIRTHSNSPSVDITNNWWGTTSLDEIEKRIRDFHDDTTKCEADFAPILPTPDLTAPVTPVRNLIKTNNGGSITLTWSANPESDIAGYRVYWGDHTGYSFSNSVDVGMVTSYVLTGADYSQPIAVTAYDADANNSSDQCLCHESWFTKSLTPEQAGVGIAEVEIEWAIHVYPNPFADKTTIVTPQMINNGTLLVYDAMGSLAYELKGLNGTTFELERGTLLPGLYFIELKYHLGSQYGKFVVQD